MKRKRQQLMMKVMEIRHHNRRMNQLTNMWAKQPIKRVVTEILKTINKLLWSQQFDIITICLALVVTSIFTELII